MAVSGKLASDAVHSMWRYPVKSMNVVVEMADDVKDFVENAWVSRTLTLGDGVRLSVSGPCPRCVMTTLPQGDLPKDPGILRTAAQHNQVNIGVYAAVVQGGIIRRGVPVKVE
jgi:uncharacterized protein YcbX